MPPRCRLAKEVGSAGVRCRTASSSAAGRLGQRLTHSRAFWQASHHPTFRPPAGSAAASCWDAKPASWCNECPPSLARPLPPDFSLGGNPLKIKANSHPATFYSAGNGRPEPDPPRLHAYRPRQPPKAALQASQAGPHDPSGRRPQTTACRTRSLETPPAGKGEQSKHKRGQNDTRRPNGLELRAA
jgi:hypothetical protein